MVEVHLTPVSADEHVQVAKVLAISMLTAPIHIAVLRGQGELQRQHLEVMFSAMLKDRPGDLLLAKRQGTIVGVLRSCKCQGSQLSLDQARRRPGEDEAELSDIHARIEHWKCAWDERDPQEPHWHLGPVGVLPQFHRMGLGSKLMEKFCEQVDANGEPAFLETDSLANVRFYEKFRFRTIDESLVFGVRNFFMWRPAQE
jgi:ribosomal protein S18 acetylase RimI-like enzyme